MGFIKQPLSSKQESKTKTDLHLIDKITKVARGDGMRVIISGGYAVDGFLREITRYHNDIDIQIYGTEDNARDVVKGLLNSLSAGVEYAIEDKGRKEYYYNIVYTSKDTTLDIYYLQTKVSPLGKYKSIIKNDGSISHQEFSEPKFGEIGDIKFEIQGPEIELKDKIYKREVRGDVKRLEHEQDISNLKQKLAI